MVVEIRLFRDRVLDSFHPWKGQFEVGRVVSWDFLVPKIQASLVEVLLRVFDGLNKIFGDPGGDCYWEGEIASQVMSIFAKKNHLG